MRRAPALALSGLALLAVTAACGSDGDPDLDEIHHELRTRTFVCGVVRCKLAQEYCVRRHTNSRNEQYQQNQQNQGEADTSTCRTIPPRCAGPGVCSCLGAETCYEDGERVIVDASES